MNIDPKSLPRVRGALTFHRSLSDLTWLRVGGAAEVFFQPADVEDLQNFLKQLPREIPVFPMGAASNLIVRDGGIRGIVIRLGRGFNGFEINGSKITVGAAALDAQLAKKAAAEGVDLTFLRTIPGTIGGAVAMNAGCYGQYIADVFQSAQAVMRDGELKTLSAHDLAFGYRNSAIPQGAILVEATLKGNEGDAAELEARMRAQLKKRDNSQPTKDRTAGSTFRNPAGFSSTGRADDVHDLKAWKVIDDAGMRGATLGGAVMNEMHSNFLTNTGNATAAYLEDLGEAVREEVRTNSSIELVWEIRRIGDR